MSYLKHDISTNLKQEKEKAHYGFKARGRAIERIGLTEVRGYRQSKLQVEQQQWERDYQERQKLKPELNALLLLRVRPAG